MASTGAVPGKFWERLARITHRGPAAAIIAVAVILGVVGVIEGRKTPIGDTQAGVPELRAQSRYNRDNDVITSRFSIGVDVLTAVVESEASGCVAELASDADPQAERISVALAASGTSWRVMFRMRSMIEPTPHDHITISRELAEIASDAVARGASYDVR